LYKDSTRFEFWPIDQIPKLEIKTFFTFEIIFLPKTRMKNRTMDEKHSSDTKRRSSISKININNNTTPLEDRVNSQANLHKPTKAGVRNRSSLQNLKAQVCADEEGLEKYSDMSLIQNYFDIQNQSIMPSLNGKSHAQPKNPKGDDQASPTHEIQETNTGHGGPEPLPTRENAFGSNSNRQR
jgi:hypothetical protein